MSKQIQQKHAMPWCTN